MRVFRSLVLGLSIVAAAILPSRRIHAAEIDQAQFQAHLKALTARPHRLAGTPEGRGAGDYIEAKLRELPGTVFTQRFSFPQEIVETCELRVGSNTVPLLPLAANGMQPSVTGSEGITGRVVYVGALRFSVSDVLDWPGLVKRIKTQAPSEAPSPGKRLWQLLDEGLRRDLEALPPSEPISDGLRARFALAVDDKVLGAPDLYDEPSWRGIELREETQHLVRKKEFGLRRHEIFKLNRLALEDAYPDEIARGANGKRLSDSIVLTDLESVARFADLFRLGAKAVVFVRSDRDDPDAPGSGRTFVSADLPRFYLSEAAARDAGLLAAERGTIVSQVRWEARTGRNLFLWIPGTDPIFRFDNGEYLILSAHYDSGGIVPYNAPCQEAAANCAALLETARVLASDPPRRSALVAFFDNHANFLQGGRRFYAALRRSMPGRIDDPLPVRRRFVDEERAFLKRFLEFIAMPDILQMEHDLKDRALKRLGDEAKYRYNRFLEALTDLRLELHHAQAGPETDAQKREVEALKAQTEQLEADQRAWQAVRESIRDRAPIPETEERARQCFGSAIEQMARQIEGRLKELDEVEAALDDELALTAPLAGANPVCHASFRFTAGSERWLFLPEGLQQHMRVYGALLDHVSAELDDAGGAAAKSAGFVWDSRATWETAYASASAYSGWSALETCHLASVFEIPSMGLVTELDRAPLRDKPDASVSDESLDRIRIQASNFLTFLRPLANEEWASVANRMPTHRDATLEDYLWVKDSVEGHSVRSFSYGDTEANKVEHNVLVHIMDRHYRADCYVFTDGNGCFPLVPVCRRVGGQDWWRLQIEAARFDGDGRVSNITTAVPGGPRASVNAQWHKAGWYWPKVSAGYFSILTMFEGAQGHLLGRYRPLEGNFPAGAGRTFRMLHGLSNSEFQRIHFRFDALTGVGLYHVKRPLGVKVVYQHPKNPDDVALYINATSGSGTGIGYGPGNGEYDGDDQLTLDLELDMARDMFALNESRLDRLRRKNIVLNFVEYLHSQAEVLLKSLGKAMAANRHDDATTHAAAIAAIERRLYRPVIATTDDMVKAVTVLLILAIPFAFSLQALLLPSYNVYRRIAGFAVFFALSFVVLYFTHPAFAFSATPAVIILAFIIMVMSGAVIWVIGDKFNYEIKKLQGLAVAAHTLEQRLVGNVAAAVSLAISIMQRRPVRTALTVVTALLLTFTILSFVAFQGEQGINEFYKGPGEDQVSRLMFRDRVWKTVGGPAEAWRRYLRLYHGTRFDVHGRYWLTRELTVQLLQEELCIPVRHQSGRGTIAGAMMSVDGIELDRLRQLRDALPAEGLDEFVAGTGVYLSEALAEKLEAKPGDKLTIRGHDVRFLGTFDTRALTELRQVDGSPFMPVNFGVTRMALGALTAKGSAGGGTDPMADLEEELAQLEPEALESVSPHALIVVPTAMAKAFNMTLKAVVVWPREGGQDLEQLAKKLAVLNYGNVYLNQGGDRRQFVYGEKYGMAGAWDIAIPLILGGLIIFSTMLGSIIDREKEIYTFSALGLAPKSVAMLFFVEAAIYAVMGGFGGYLFSQIVTRVLEVLAAHGIFRAPEMNYSSSTVIYTILLVMATVLVSTIYPAIKAAKKATADTTSHWHVPPAKGDLLQFDFPFTISRYDITGIICFIREHFANHADPTVGKFAADHVEIWLEPEHGLAALRAHNWLQPFDQGISQSFQLTASPSDIEEVCEIHVQLERLSGPPAAWKRSYRLFLVDLRSQFLLWRTLEDEAREHYLVAADGVEEELGIVVG